MRNLFAGISVAAVIAMGTSALADSPTFSQIDQIDLSKNGDVMEAWRDKAVHFKPRHPKSPDGPTPSMGRHADPMHPDDPFIRRVKDREKTEHDSANAWVDQIGKLNKADIDQRHTGNGAVADVIQIGDRNKAEVDQDSNGQSRGDYAVITTVGDENGARIRQNNTGNNFSDDNQADIQQGNDGSGAQFPGSGNTSEAYRSVASIDQDGEDHRADINQYETNGSFASYNEAAIKQRGDNANARIDQDGDYNDASIYQTGLGLALEASSYQEGDFNDSRITQEGEAHDAKVSQVGDYNAAEIVQLGGFDNDASIMQEGDWNSGVTIQYGSFNDAETVQDGDYNSASILQDGVDNSGTILQDNDHNKASLEQLGIGNLAFISQSGNDFANVQQHGFSNSALVRQ